MLKLQLKKLPALRGIYGANKDKLGEHQLFAHPDLFDSITRLEGAGVRLVFSDIFRSAKASLDAKRAKPHLVMPAGFSAHNFGLAVDIDVQAVCKELGLDKRKLDELLAGFGLYCHRIDHKTLAECWHYNALGDDAKRWLGAMTTSTAPSVEKKIQALYGDALKLSSEEVSAALRSLGYFDKETSIRSAVQRFQEHWDLAPDGVAGPKTQRLLAYLTCKTEVLP